jgi:hypothetical protein
MMPPYLTPSERAEPAAWRKVYFYLRTSTALELATDAWPVLDEAFAEAPREPRALWLDQEYTWPNGIVLRADMLDDAPFVADRFKNALDKFSAWSVLDDRGNYSASESAAPVTHFLNNVSHHSSGKLPCSQIFVMWDDENPWNERILQDLRGSLRGRCAPVFFFENGQVIFVETSESAKITAQRCGRAMKGLWHWCILDRDQETISKNGDAVNWWDFINLAEPISE